VAASGKFVHQWELLKPAVAALAGQVSRSWQRESLALSSPASLQTVFSMPFARLTQALDALPDPDAPGPGRAGDAAKGSKARSEVTRDDAVTSILSLAHAPFTLQRMCELVLPGAGGYTSRGKLSFALVRLAAVTTPLLPVAIEDRWDGCDGDQDDAVGWGGGAAAPVAKRGRELELDSDTVPTGAASAGDTAAANGAGPGGAGDCIAGAPGDGDPVPSPKRQRRGPAHDRSPAGRDDA